MTYDSKHVKMLDPKEWYDLVFDKYWEYHSYLDGFDNFAFSRFLPRGRDNLRIVDLWSWDGRLYKSLSDLKFIRYVACDISEKLLSKHPGKVEKIVCNLESPLPFDGDSFDLAVSFFVIEHLSNIEFFFEEIYRILDKNWTFILWYFFQRRSFEWKVWKDSFKIKIYNHRLEDVLKYWKNAGFEVNTLPVKEKGNLIWNIFVFEKN